MFPLAYIALNDNSLFVSQLQLSFTTSRVNIRYSPHELHHVREELGHRLTLQFYFLHDSVQYFQFMLDS